MGRSVPFCCLSSLLLHNPLSSEPYMLMKGIVHLHPLILSSVCANTCAHTHTHATDLVFKRTLIHLYLTLIKFCTVATIETISYENHSSKSPIPNDSINRVIIISRRRELLQCSWREKGLSSQQLFGSATIYRLYLIHRSHREWYILLLIRF